MTLPARSSCWLCTISPTAGCCRKYGLAQAEGDKWHRPVIQKPFGYDLESARKLNDIVESVFPADAVFRTDQYLGKETVQNIPALPFANQLFEPLWNATTWTMSRSRWSRTSAPGRILRRRGRGPRRDPEPHAAAAGVDGDGGARHFNADHLRAEKEKVLAAVKLPEDLSTHSARGRFAGGWQGGEQVQGYLEEEGIPADSTTDTFAAIRGYSTPGAGPGCRSTFGPVTAWSGG